MFLEHIWLVLEHPSSSLTNLNQRHQPATLVVPHKRSRHKLPVGKHHIQPAKRVKLSLLLLSVWACQLLLLLQRVVDGLTDGLVQGIHGV